MTPGSETTTRVVSAAGPGPASARAAWTAVLVLLLLYALAFTDRQIISLLVAPIRRDLAISDVQISLLQGVAFALLYSTCGVPLGFAADRFSRRWVIFFGVTVWALAASACGLARTFPELLAARFLVGMGEAALAPAAYSILGDLFAARRLTFALSIYSIGALAGAALSLALGAAIVRAFASGLTLPVVGHLRSWQAAFLVTGAPGLPIAFLVFAIPEPARRGRRRAATATWAELWTFVRSRLGFFSCHVVGFASIMTMAYATLAWNPTFLTRVYHWPIAKIGVVLAAFGFATGAASFLFSGWAVDALQRRGVADAHFRFYIPATAVLALCGALAYQAPGPSLFFPLVALTAVALNMAGVAASAVQIVTPPQLRGRVSALYLMICGLAAMSLGPSVVALFTDKVFHGDARIGASLSATIMVFSPIAIAAFTLGLAPMRRAVAAADASNLAPEA